MGTRRSMFCHRWGVGLTALFCTAIVLACVSAPASCSGDEAQSACSAAHGLLPGPVNGALKSSAPVLPGVRATWAVALALPSETDVRLAKALGLLDARMGVHEYEAAPQVACRLRRAQLRPQVLGGVSEFALSLKGGTVASDSGMVRADARHQALSQQGDASTRVEGAPKSLPGGQACESGYISIGSRPEVGGNPAPKVGAEEPPARVSDRGPAEGPSQDSAAEDGQRYQNPIQLYSGEINLYIPDNTGQGAYYRMRNPGAVPSTARVTRVDYRIRIEDDGDDGFYCGDYEIWLFSNDPAWECLVYDNLGGRTDGGWDDDVDDDDDIYLNWRTTHCFDGEKATKWWGAIAYDNRSVDDGQLDYVEFKVYWSDGKCITVKRPNGRQKWRRGRCYNIKWKKSSSSGSYVNIDLYRKGSYYRRIASCTWNDRRYRWCIPYSVRRGKKYKIKVTSCSDSSCYDRSDRPFRIK